jgi:TRAP-type C4-dicarboxylate transport system permease small subunit
MLGQIIDGASTFFGHIAALLMVITAVIITYEVIVRKLGHPTTWTFDFSIWFQLATIFFGLGYTQRLRANIQVDLFARRLSIRQQVGLRIFGYTIGVIAMGLMTWQGAVMVFDAIATNQMTREMTRIPAWWTMWMIPLGSLIVTLQLLRQLAWDVAWLRRGTGGTLEELELLSQEELELRAALQED